MDDRRQFPVRLHGRLRQDGRADAFGGGDHLLPKLHFADFDVRAGSRAWRLAGNAALALADYAGAVGFTALFAYFYAITLLPLATAVTLNYTSAIFLALYLGFAGMQLGKGMLGALALGLIGVIMLLKPTMHADQLVGGLIGLGSGVMAGMAYFSVRQLGARGESEIRTVFYFSLVSSVGAGAWLVFSELHGVDLKSGLLLLGVACFATLAQLAMTRAYSRGKTLMSAALAYSTVIFSSLFGMLFWREVLDASAWAAIGLIILSGVAATHFSRASPVEQD